MKELLGSLELNRIYQMDCLEGMKLIPDKSIDAIICDPPFGTTNNKWDSIIPLDKLWKEYERIIKDKGAIVLFSQQPFTSKLVMSNPKLFKYEWIWRKNWASGHLNSKKQPMRNHENILVFYKKQCTYNFIKQPRVMKEQTKKRHSYGYKTNDGKEQVTANSYNDYKEMSRVKELDLEMAFPTTVQEFDVIHRSKMLHPTQKPIELIEYLIKTYTDESNTVLDNCMGSGTTAVAATLNNRKWLGFETESKYIEIANKRLDNISLEDDLNKLK